MTGNMNPDRIKRAVDLIASQLAAESDIPSVEVGTKTVTVRQMRGVQDEVVSHLTRLSIKNGVPIFMIVMGENGCVQYTPMSTLDKMCVVCTKGVTKLHDDGVCFDCRDPLVEPGEQVKWGSYTERLGTRPVVEEKDDTASSFENDELARAFYYDIKEGAKVGFLIEKLIQVSSKASLARALRQLANDVDK